MSTIEQAINDVDSTVAPPSARPVGRPKDAGLQTLVNKFLKYKPATATKPGQSFFLEGAKSRDVVSFRRAVLKAGAGMLVVEVERDEIFQVPGVRCWRQAGEYDEL